MKKSLDIQIGEKALIEINDAYKWYEDQKVGLGKVFENALDETFKTIQNSIDGLYLLRKIS